MIVTVPSVTHLLGKQSSGYLIKDPKKVITDFTVTKDADAAKALDLQQQSQIKELKTFLKAYDMTAITTAELETVGRKLYHNNLIDVHAYKLFAEGNNALDEHGRATRLEVKFNAIALFDQRLEEQKEQSSTDTAAQKSQSQFLPQHKAMRVANQAINALAYFANSARRDLAIDERT